MKQIKLIKNSIFIIFSLLILSSCSEIGLLDQDTMPIEIYGVGDFLKTYFILQISILIIGLLISIFFGEIGSIISLVLHFIWVVGYRDYGFWTVLLLFFLFSIVTYFIRPLILIIKNSIRK